jgi:MFS family permease
MTSESSPPPAPVHAIPRGVWVLGIVSLLMDISSEMIHSLLPLYLTASLGASVLTVGFIEGIAEATAMIVKVFSGTLSDAWGKRKWLAAAGYGLGALSKPLFALAGSAGTVFAARFIDRIGKGIRGAPRDALIADLTDPSVHGAAFGLRQTLDTVGAVAGPLVAIALMLAWSDNFRAVFWVAVIPGVLSFALIAFAVREPERKVAPSARPPINWGLARDLGPAFWGVVVVGSALTLARFSEAFLVLRAQDLGVTIAYAPLVMVVMSLVFALVAYPAGKLADRVSRTLLLVLGTAFLVAADIVLALATGVVALGAGVILWGIHMGFTQGLLSAMVAGTAPEHLRGTAFGVFNLFSGVALLVASALAGAVWHYLGPSATFWTGAGLAMAALLLTRFGAFPGARRDAARATPPSAPREGPGS